METTSEWIQLVGAICAGIAVLITAWTNYRVSVIKAQQDTQKEQITEVKHLVNSTQTNLQTSIDDLRVENQGLRQDKADARAGSVQQVEVVNEPNDPVPVKPETE